MGDTIIIAAGFNGPRLSGNGGYVGGLMAGRFTEKFGGDGAVEVTLRAPIPIDRKLQVAHGDEVLMLRDGETLLCEARAGSVAHLSPPPPPTDWNDVMRRGEAGGAVGRERIRVQQHPGRNIPPVLYEQHALILKARVLEIEIAPVLLERRGISRVIPELR